jgi:hypothetical protein
LRDAPVEGRSAPERAASRRKTARLEFLNEGTLSAATVLARGRTGITPIIRESRCDPWHSSAEMRCLIRYFSRAASMGQFAQGSVRDAAVLSRDLAFLGPLLPLLDISRHVLRVQRPFSCLHSMSS